MPFFSLDGAGGRRRHVITALAVLVLITSVGGLVATALAGESDLPGKDRYGAVPQRTAGRTEAQGGLDAGRASSPTPVPTPERFMAPVDRMAITAIGIDAPLVPMGVTPDGYMDLPYSPHQVAWYEFTSKPGAGGNAVFSAHVDYINYGPAVFWNLSRLQQGDTIDIRLKDGTVLTYTVTENVTIPLEDLDMGALLAPTDTETVTLITCAGQFYRGNYSHRVVVKAVRTSAQHATS